MHHPADLLLTLFIVYVAGQILSEVAQRLRMPAVVGEIVAGCIIGPSCLGWIAISDPLEALSEIGVVLLMFSVGLETRLGELKKVGIRASIVGTSGVLLPFILGGGWAYFSGYPLAKAMFIGAAFVATSAGITARVLQELKVLNRIESRIILGAAVIDDILAMLLLGVVSSIGEQGVVEIWSLSITLIEALAFLVLGALIGTSSMQRFSPMLERPINPLSPLTIALAGCIGLSVLASKIGLAAIIGAFLAGSIMAEAQQKHTLEKQLQPIMALIVPFFFVTTGAKIELTQLFSFAMIGSLILITFLAIISKLLGCGLAALPLGIRSALIVGIGMVPRGEVGIIVGSLGREAGIFSDDVYALIIAMSLLTSIVAAPLLRRLFQENTVD